MNYFIPEESYSSDSSSSSENGYGDDDEDNGSDSEDSGLDPELDELATIMKTSLNPENGISNWNRTKIKTNNNNKVS